MNKRYSLIGLIIIAIIAAAFFLFFKGTSHPPIDNEPISSGVTNHYQGNSEVELYDKYVAGEYTEREYLEELTLLLIRQKLGNDFSEEKTEQLLRAAAIARESNDLKELAKSYREILTEEEYNKFMGY